jgi:cytochrome b6-f complex iron-sulfur subunit
MRMAIENEPRNAGRRVITQEEADAIQAKARPDAPPVVRRSRVKITRREALVYALAGSTALYLGATAATMTAPDPGNDPLLKSITPPEFQEVVPGGFAYPRFRAGEFGGAFVLSQPATAYTVEQAPELNPNGKFYVAKVNNDPGTAQTPPSTSEKVIAIYQVCTHLGCLIPFIQSENRFICPCHGSTFERNSDYVRGPAGRNLDQFEVQVADDGTITVNTGAKLTGLASN